MLISSSVGGKTLVYSLCPVVLVAFVLFSKLPCQVINDSDLFNLFYFICQCPSTYQKYKCVEVTECKLYMRVDDTKNYKRDNPEYRI